MRFPPGHCTLILAGALIDFYSPETLLLEDILAAPRDLALAAPVK